MPNAWDRLPNGGRIDAIIKGPPIRMYPNRCQFGMDSRASADKQAYDRVLSQGRQPIWSALWTYTAKAYKPYLHEHYRLFDACHALIAWDDCEYLFDLDPDAVRLLAGVGNDAAILLYPAILAQHKVRSNQS